MIIAPDEIADPMTVHDKVVSGFKDSVSPSSAAGWLSTAGWQHLRNSSPNYGTDAGAFGQRLGAATIRATSEGLFRESVFAPLFHEDPRYYIMGKGHPFSKRLVYAATRSIITRTDSGHATPNFARLAGDAAASALTIPYYPAQNTTFSAVASTFGGSLGGSALSFVVDEFLVDALVDLKVKEEAVVTRSPPRTMESKPIGEHFNASVADIRAAAVRNDAKNLGVNVHRRGFHLFPRLLAPARPTKRWAATSKNT